MKRIVKNPESGAFHLWKEEWRKNDIEPGWCEFDGKPIKQIVKAALIEEQGGLCCFCESRVKINGGHIAHLLDRHNYPDLALTYNNLLYSCPENPHNNPQTCGHAQGNHVLPVSPLDENCETQFVYSEDGSILGKSDDARNTIRILNLNGSKRMCDGRKAVYEETHENKDTLTPSEFDCWINSELKPQTDGTFQPFWTTIKYAAGLYDR